MPDTNNVKFDSLKTHRENLLRHTYFIMAFTGTAIGYALQRSESAKISWWNFPLVLAVLAWFLSLCFGNRYIENLGLLAKAEHEFLIDTPYPPGVAAIAESELNKFAARTSRIYRNQIRLLMAGAIFFVAWRVSVTLPKIGRH